MNLFRNILGSPAARRFKDFLFFFPHAEAQSRRGLSFPVEVLGAPHSNAGNSREVTKEQASRLRSQVLDRQDAGAPREGLCVSAALREKILKVFSAQNVMPHRRAALPDLLHSKGLSKIKNNILCASASLREVFKKPQIKICDNLRNLRMNKLFLLPIAFCLLPLSKTEFAS